MCTGASEVTLSCVVQEQDAGRAVALLHAAFFTGMEKASSLVPLDSVVEVVDLAQADQ